jgi:hypothetical protein
MMDIVGAPLKLHLSSESGRQGGASEACEWRSVHSIPAPRDRRHMQVILFRPLRFDKTCGPWYNPQPSFIERYIP